MIPCWTSCNARRRLQSTISLPISEPAIIDRKVVFGRVLLCIKVFEGYTRRGLTHYKDKLIAVAGIVIQPEHLWEDTYMGGYLAFGSPCVGCILTPKTTNASQLFLRWGEHSGSIRSPYFIKSRGQSFTSMELEG